jgi:aminopeptidase N
MRPRFHYLLLLAVLALPMLACQTLRKLIELEGPEDKATDAFLSSATPATPTPRPTRTPGPIPTAQPTLPLTLIPDADARWDLRPEFAADADLFPDATRYTIDVTVDFTADGSATLTGRERVRFTNPQSAELDHLYLMLWPNDDQQYFSDVELSNVTINGTPAEFTLEHDGLAARIELTETLAQGESVELSAEFFIKAFPGIDSRGPARFGLTSGILLAPTFYPLVPRLVEGEWQTQPAPPGGDTTNSDAAFYVWRVTAPAGMAIIGTGRVVDETQSGDTHTQTLITGPVRDLALVVGPLDLAQREADGITLNAYVLPEHADYADELLDYVEAQMTTLQTRVGPYPYTELDIVDAPGAFGGIEYPGEIFIGVVDKPERLDFFETATVHEVGHQWFYGLIGDDQLLQPWLDEAAATYTEVLYAEEIYGPEAAQTLLDEFRAYLQFSGVNAELPIGLGVGEYDDSEYGLVVYIKGALFFDALRRELGDETFFAFLHNYFDEHRYGFASTADFQRGAEETCACELDELFDVWVHEGGAIEP